MKEEIIALVPVVLLLVRRLGFDAVTAVAASLGAAAVGAAFSPLNPFQVGIAQRLAQLPPLSGDRKSTRLNSSHGYISYAVFCLKKKKRVATTSCADSSL